MKYQPELFCNLFPGPKHSIPCMFLGWKKEFLDTCYCLTALQHIIVLGRGWLMGNASAHFVLPLQYNFEYYAYAYY